jgi:hypothetical protein
MLNKIVEALNKRSDLAGWTVRHLLTRGAQVYAVPEQIESQRLVNVQRYRIDVLRQTSRPDGTEGMGSGDVTLLPVEIFRRRLNKLCWSRGSFRILFTLPAPSLPDVRW